MSDTQVVDIMSRQYADMLAGIEVFGVLQTLPNTMPVEFQAMRKEILGKIHKARYYLKEAENQVKLLQLRDECAQPREDTCPGCRVPDVQRTLPRFFADVETFLTSTYYTILKEPLKRQWPYYCLISLPAARWRGKGPSMYGYFVHPGEATQETKACYGQDIVYLPIEQFRHLHP